MAAVYEANGLMNVTPSGEFTNPTVALGGALAYSPTSPGKGIIRIKIGTAEHHWKLQDLSPGKVFLSTGEENYTEPTYNAATDRIEVASTYQDFANLTLEIDVSGKASCKVEDTNGNSLSFSGSGNGQTSTGVGTWSSGGA